MIELQLRVDAASDPISGAIGGPGIGLPHAFTGYLELIAELERIVSRRLERETTVEAGSMRRGVTSALAASLIATVLAATAAAGIRASVTVTSGASVRIVVALTGAASHPRSIIVSGGGRMFRLRRVPARGAGGRLEPSAVRPPGPPSGSSATTRW